MQWPEGKGWKVMKQNDMKSITEGRFKIGSLKMGAD